MSYDRAAIRNRIIRNFNRPQCQLCGKFVSLNQQLDLHEIINRGRLGSKENLENLPIELHAVICRECNSNNGRVTADSKKGRIHLLKTNAMIYGYPRLIEVLEDYKHLIPEEYKVIYDISETYDSSSDTLPFI